MAYATADLRIVTNSAINNPRSLDAKFTVSRITDDTARMVRVIILLPLNVIVKKIEVVEKKKGIEGYHKTNGMCSEKCEVTWESSIAISRIPNGKYDSYISIDLAYLDNAETAEIILSTTKPPPKYDKTFGAFVYGSLPDLSHKNNYVVATCI